MNEGFSESPPPPSIFFQDGFDHGEQTIALRQQDAVKRVVSTSQLSTSELPEDEMEEFLTVNW